MGGSTARRSGSDSAPMGIDHWADCGSTQLHRRGGAVVPRGCSAPGSPSGRRVRGGAHVLLMMVHACMSQECSHSSRARAARTVSDLTDEVLPELVLRGPAPRHRVVCSWLHGWLLWWALTLGLMACHSRSRGGRLELTAAMAAGALDPLEHPRGRSARDGDLPTGRAAGRSACPHYPPRRHGGRSARRWSTAHLTGWPARQRVGVRAHDDSVAVERGQETHPPASDRGPAPAAMAQGSGGGPPRRPATTPWAMTCAAALVGRLDNRRLLETAHSSCSMG